MNIYMRELRAHWKSLITWSISMLFLNVAGMGKYSAGVGAGNGSFNELMKQMPESLQNLFGVGVYDLSIAMDYYGVLFLYIALLASIHAIMLGIEIISKEEQDKTAEFLMVKPISRTQIITSKLLSAISMVFVLNMITYISSFFMLSYYSKEEPFWKAHLTLMLGLLVLQILFTILGGFLASFIRKPKLAFTIGTSTLMLMFLLSALMDITKKLDFLRFFTLFKYFDAKDILKGRYDITYSIITIILLVTFSYGIYFFYNRRDLNL